MQQFTENGSVVESRTKDFGIFQVNVSHFKEARQMGYDPMTPEGNTAYAIYLYQTQGTAPWNSSSACWKPKQLAVNMP